MIRLQEVTKRFGTVSAVHRVSFEVRKGEVLGLLGENGAGKTTAMRMIGTTIQPTEGEITVDGYSVRKHPMEVRSRIGLLFGGEVGLYNRLTARENILYFGNLYGLPKERLQAQLDHLTESLGMGDFLDRRVGGFSRGMKQKVAIARALIHDPEYILLDEPTTGLDVTAASVFRQLIRRMKEEGKTILFSSHHMGEVEKLCDRVVVLHKGNLRYEGTVQELKTQYNMNDLDEIFMRLIGGDEE